MFFFSFRSSKDIKERVFDGRHRAQSPILFDSQERLYNMAEAISVGEIVHNNSLFGRQRGYMNSVRIKYLYKFRSKHIFFSIYTCFTAIVFSI